MKNRHKIIYTSLAIGICAAIAFVGLSQWPADNNSAVLKKIRSTGSPKASFESKKARADYFFRMLRDPATNAIPANIRRGELAYAQTLPVHGEGPRLVLNKATGQLQTATGFTWKEVGPTDVGGRTRPLLSANWTCL
jgi:hypothetical protein